MDRISLEPITRELCHRFYKGFENDPAIYMDMGTLKTYIYDVEKVDKYFESQISKDRVVFMIMRIEEPIGEVKLKYIDNIKKECSLGIHLQNDVVKGLGIGTIAERMVLDYAFKELGMKKVYADAVQKNKRSQHVLEKVGFQFVNEDDMFKYYVIER